METLLVCLSLSGERLKISLSPVLRVATNRTAAIVISFAQFKGTPEHPYAFYVDFSSNTSSKRLGLVTESKIVNGTANFSFSATHSGNLRVVAEFRVGPQNHRVTSNVVRVICK